MDGIYEVVLGGVNARGLYGENVSHWQITGTSGTDPYATAQALLIGFVANVANPLLSLLSTECTLNILHAKRVDGTGGPTAFNPFAGTGADLGDMQTMAAAIDVAFYPGGALNRAGHWFLWGFRAAKVIADVIDPTYLGNVLTFFATTASGFTIGGSGVARMVTYTKKTKTGTPILHVDVRPKLTGMNKRTLPFT